MTSPKLTVTVPTFNRPDMLPRMLDSLLTQTVPVRVIVSDDGDCARTHSILRARYADALRGGNLVHLRSGATDPWSNWKAGAEAADTEYFSWAQDDDVVSPHYAERILFAFSEVERQGHRPHVWMARLECSDATGTMAIPLAGNGPMVPTRSLHGICEAAHWSGGKALAASMYLTSHSLSPAQAYRNGPEFRAALAAMPPGCEIYIERLMPAEMAQHGGFIADPAIVGLWVQHDGHLSHQQHSDQPRQTGLFLTHMDALLDRLDGWQGQFSAWCGVIPPNAILAWLQQFDQTEAEGGKSKHGDEIRRLMVASLDGRIRAVPGPDDRPWWRRAWDRLGRRAAA